jgi:hypothetical protein
MHQEPQHESHQEEQCESGNEKKFHGWRLLGVIMAVIVVLAVASFVIDWMVIGPLEGRLF